MKIHYPSAHFSTSCASAYNLPTPDGAEVAFAGRSNAGKSSTLNRLCKQRALARVSKTPGRTQMINFFLLQTGQQLVDLPGYGFAKAPQKEQDRWHRLIETYLAQRPVLRGLVIVMDARRGLTDYDRQMLDWCNHRELPTHALLNKADKLKRGALQDALREVKTAVEDQYQNVSVQAFSAAKGTGLDMLYKKLDEWLAE
jgi:GTP-binding protein